MPNPRERRKTIDIENSFSTTNEAVIIETGGRPFVELVIRGDGSADYSVDAEDERQGGWMNDTTTYSSQQDVSDVLRTGVQRVRVRCTSGTGGTNDTADILLSASGV